MKNVKLHIINFLIFGLIFTLSPLGRADAAVIGFSPPTGTYKVGDTISVKVYVGAESKSINAVSAYVKFPKNLLSLSSISKSGSIINLWAQEPSFSNTDGVASFEGIILSGYSGNSGNTITLVFKAKAVGTANLSFNSASVLANDGNGTDVLYAKKTASFKIIKKEITPILPTPEEKAPEIDTTIAISEIKNNISAYSPSKFLITSPQPVINDSYVIQIDSLPAIIWSDDGTHIYQAPELPNGLHTIKVMAIDEKSNQLSGFLSFYTTLLKIPVVTYYSENLYVDDFMVLKGIADSSVDVEITISNKETRGIILEHVSTNGDGKFTFVPENKIPVGTYSVIARSIAANGISSGYMTPIQITVREHELTSIVSVLSKYMTIIIPFVALLVLLILLVLHGYYRIRRYRLTLNKKLLNVQNVILKDFETLQKDSEKTNITDFKEDVINSEKEILQNLKDVEN